MKTANVLYPTLFIAGLVFLCACHKSGAQDASSSDTGSGPAGPPMRKDIPSPQTTLHPIVYSYDCSPMPSYGDSIIYPQASSNKDYIVPLVNYPGPGKYFSWPEGLAIDSTTGAIDVTKSETGMRYDIGFIQQGSPDTCINSLIIAGSSYVDSVYVSANGSTDAAPYFNASLGIPSPCSGNGNKSGCAFDITGSAAAQRIIVGKSTGQIDLKKTFDGDGIHAGAFGLLPYNGETVTTTMFYKLNDASNNAVQQITLQLAFYESKSQVPPGLMSDFSQEYSNLISNKILSSSYNPRPPLVIIVRHL